MSFLPDKESVIELYKVLDGPTNAAAIDVDDQLLNNALLYAKDYRSRYNIFKLADECGVLSQIIEHMAQHEQK
jgi:glycerol dehydrogenase-like iron-containing ADH family enzyme